MTNGAGCAVRLLRPPATEPVAQTQAKSDGSYRFERLTAGSYTVQAAAADPAIPPVERTNVVLDGSSQAQVDLTLPKAEAPKMRWTVEDGGEAPGFSLVRCAVAERPGYAVSLWTYGWGGITQMTGSKPEYGPDACEFAPLGPGVYFVELEVPAEEGQAQTVRAEVNLPPNRVVWVRFEGGTIPSRSLDSAEEEAGFGTRGRAARQ